MSPRARQVLWGFLFSNLSYQTTGRSMIKVELENLPRCLSSLLAVRIKMSHWLGEMSPTQDVLIGSPIFTLRAFLRLLRLLRSFHRKRRRHIHESPHSASQRPDLYAPVLRRPQAAQRPHTARHRQDGRITSLRPFQNQSETPSPAITLAGLHCRYEA